MAMSCRRTEAVRRKPYSVILLDEVEKAMQVMDDGGMTDGQGAHGGFQEYGRGHDVQSRFTVMGEVKTYFRPEFINRIDEVVVFHPLDEKNTRSIARIQLQYLESQLAKLEMKLNVTDGTLDEISRADFDPVFSARPLKRAIQSQIENPLAEGILEGRFGPKGTITVNNRNGGTTFAKS